MSVNIAIQHIVCIYKFYRSNYIITVTNRKVFTLLIHTVASCDTDTFICT